MLKGATQPYEGYRLIHCPPKPRRYSFSSSLFQHWPSCFQHHPNGPCSPRVSRAGATSTRSASAAVADAVADVLRRCRASGGKGALTAAPEVGVERACGLGDDEPREGNDSRSPRATWSCNAQAATAALGRNRLSRADMNNPVLQPSRMLYEQAGDELWSQKRATERATDRTAVNKGKNDCSCEWHLATETDTETRRGV